LTADYISSGKNLIDLREYLQHRRGKRDRS
jgi:hypothetical protein